MVHWAEWFIITLPPHSHFSLLPSPCPELQFAHSPSSWLLICLAFKSMESGGSPPRLLALEWEVDRDYTGRGSIWIRRRIFSQRWTPIISLSPKKGSWEWKELEAEDVSEDTPAHPGEGGGERRKKEALRGH